MSINQPYNRYSEQPCRTRCSTFNVSIVKLKIRPRLEPAHVQPEASETFTQHRANPVSASRSEGLRPDYTCHHHPTARLLGIPRDPPNHRASPAHRRHHDSSHSSSRACASGRTEASQLEHHDKISETQLVQPPTQERDNAGKRNGGRQEVIQAP